MDSNTSEQRQSSRQARLDTFALRVRTLAALRRLGIVTVGQVRSLSDQDLLEVTNIGAKSVSDLRQAAARNLSDETPLSSLVSPRPLSDRDQAVVEMRATGAQLSAIARRFGISRSRVVQILERARTSSAPPAVGS